MKKTRKPKLSQSEKSDLKKLREKGLYKPKNPRKPTRYGKSLLRKFADVLSGSAKAVKTDKATARKYRRKDAHVGDVRSKGDHVIVPVQKGEKVSVSKKEHEVRVYRQLETGQRYIRTPFARRPRSYDDLAKQLKPDDRIVVPYYRGKNKPVEWTYFDLVEFYNTFVGGYAAKETAQAREKALKWALEGAQISRYVARS